MSVDSQHAWAIASWEAERKTQRYTYWAMLRRAKRDYDSVSLDVAVEYRLDTNDFYYFLQHNYGIKPDIIDGKLAQTYTVVDEKKHMLFLLKYSS